MSKKNVRILILAVLLLFVLITPFEYSAADEPEPDVTVNLSLIVNN